MIKVLVVISMLAMLAINLYFLCKREKTINLVAEQTNKVKDFSTEFWIVVALLIAIVAIQIWGIFH